MKLTGLPPSLLADNIRYTRARYRASTDIRVQRVKPYRPTPAIQRQAAYLERKQHQRRKALDTPANRARMQVRERLWKWRLARTAARLKNGAR